MADDQGQAARTGASARTKKTAAAKPPAVDPERVHDAQAEVGVGLEGERQARVQIAKTKAIWDALTADFPADWIEKLPKTLKARDDDRGVCAEGSRYSADGYACGKYHARAVHLDYVGHAGITMRLNSILGPGGWDFQPMASGPEGLPIITGQAFWGKLTVTVEGETVTKWDMAANFSGPQEAIGDCLRRCAMRLGIGTYLWSKSDQALERARAAEPTDPGPEPERQQRQEPQSQELPEHVRRAYQLIAGLDETERGVIGPWWDQSAEQGHLPPRDRLEAMTPAQVSWVEGAVEQMRDRAVMERARLEAERAATEGNTPPDPQ